MMPAAGSPGVERPGDPRPSVIGPPAARRMQLVTFGKVTIAAIVSWAAFLPIAASTPTPDKADMIVAAIMIGISQVCAFIWALALQGRRDREALADRLANIMGEHAGAASAEAVRGLCTEFFGTLVSVIDVSGSPRRPAKLRAVSNRDGA